MHGADVLTVGLLVVLEAMLSADNALVMAIVVLGLPRDQQRKALRQGLGGAFISRVLATLLAVKLIALIWVKLVGGVYLLYLAYDHFSSKGGADDSPSARHTARPLFGLSPYWSTVVRLELLNLMFSIDSILVAVAMSNNVWVVMAGGVIGLLAMRLIAAQLLRLVERYPPLVDGAFVIIAWVGLELILEYLHARHWTALEVPRPLSLGLIVAIFGVAYLFARMKGPVEVGAATDAADGER